MKYRVVGLSVVLGLVLLLAATASAQNLLTWQQKNASGFGNTQNAAIASLERFNGQLYAGTMNGITGAEVWRTGNGANWVPAAAPGFGTPAVNGVVFDMIVFNGQLYAGSGGWGTAVNQARMYRSVDGAAWLQVTGDWELDPNNRAITNFAIFGNQLYASTRNTSNGAEIWRSPDGTTWTPVVTNSFNMGAGAVNYQEITGLAVFNGYLYAALEGTAPPQPGLPGFPAQVWRSADGANWSQAGPSGFGSTNNYQTGGFAVFNGFLYLGLRNDGTGGQIVRTQDGVNWPAVMSNGFGNPNNVKVEGLVSFGTLFAFTDNDVTGTEVWNSTDGVIWNRTNNPGFGNANNKGVALWSNGAAALGPQLFLGTFNQLNGGQVWAFMLNLPLKTYLPAVMR